MAAIMATSRITAAIWTGSRYWVYSNLPRSRVLEGLPGRLRQANDRLGFFT